MNEPGIYHVLVPPFAERGEQTGLYVAESLETEGFIHCCLPTQLSGVLERYFSAVDDYSVIRIDVKSLPEELQPVYENTVGGTELFPHIYGSFFRQRVAERSKRCSTPNSTTSMIATVHNATIRWAAATIGQIAYPNRVSRLSMKQARISP